MAIITVKQITELSKDEEVKKAAKEFYLDNSYKFTLNGKQQAINDLDSMKNDYPIEMVAAIQMVISQTNVEDWRQ